MRENWQPAVFGQRRPILSHPAEAEHAGVWFAAPSIIIGEQDAAQPEVSPRLQVSEFGKWSDGEKREVNVSDDIILFQADVGAGVVDPEVTEVERAVGCDGQAAGFIWVCHHLSFADLMSVPLTTFVECPRDEGAVWGNQVGTWQEGTTSKSAVHKYCVFFASYTCKQKRNKKQITTILIK